MSKRFGVLSASFLGIVACAGVDGSIATDGTDTSSDDGVEGLKVACGGIAGLKCPTGYECVMTSHIPDATGTCKKKKACVQNVMCTLNDHWDSKKCACVPNSCTKTACDSDSHWDSILCACATNYTCQVLECSSGYHCEMKGLNGGSTAVCIKN